MRPEGRATAVSYRALGMPLPRHFFIRETMGLQPLVDEPDHAGDQHQNGQAPERRRQEAAIERQLKRNLAEPRPAFAEPSPGGVGGQRGNDDAFEIFDSRQREQEQKAVTSSAMTRPWRPRQRQSELATATCARQIEPRTGARRRRIRTPTRRRARRGRTPREPRCCSDAARGSGRAASRLR